MSSSEVAMMDKCAYKRLTSEDVGEGVESRIEEESKF